MSDTAPIEHPTWLTSGDFTQADEPFRLWQAWFDEAVKGEPRDPTAMSLATVDPEGMPDVRTVLLKGVDDRGFVFYTNTESNKGRELAANPKAALLFYWKSLNRQIRIRGPVERVTPKEADAYFATRPKGAQIGAWASQQSRPLESRLAFEKAVALYGATYALGAVPRAPHAFADRREPRHRTRDREALLRGRMARHHLLAARISGELPVGNGPGGP